MQYKHASLLVDWLKHCCPAAALRVIGCSVERAQFNVLKARYALIEVC
jgi:hypothetical protein